MMTEEYMYKRLMAARLDKPPAPKPKPPTPVLTVIAERKLSLEGQRKRVTREMEELIEAERNRQPPVETNRQRWERQRADGLYYRQLYEAAARAEYFAKQADDPARHGVYDPIARFEREGR